MADDKQGPGPKPKLERGQEPSDPAFQKKMKEWNRKIALAEVTAQQAKDQAADAAKAAGRDVLKESEDTPAQREAAEARKAKEAVDKGVKDADTDAQPRASDTGVTSAATNAKKNRRSQLDEGIEGEKK